MGYLESLRTNQAILRTLSTGTALPALGLIVAASVEANTSHGSSALIPYAVGIAIASIALTNRSFRLSEKIDHLKTQAKEFAIPGEKADTHRFISPSQIKAISLGLSTIAGVCLGAYLGTQDIQTPSIFSQGEINILNIPSDTNHDQEVNIFSIQP